MSLQLEKTPKYTTLFSIGCLCKPNCCKIKWSSCLNLEKDEKWLWQPFLKGQQWLQDLRWPVHLQYTTIHSREVEQAEMEEITPQGDKGIPRQRRGIRMSTAWVLSYACKESQELVSGSPAGSAQSEDQPEEICPIEKIFKVPSVTSKCIMKETKLDKMMICTEFFSIWV